MRPTVLSTDTLIPTLWLLSGPSYEVRTGSIGSVQLNRLLVAGSHFSLTPRLQTFVTPAVEDGATGSHERGFLRFTCIGFVNEI